MIEKTKKNKKLIFVCFCMAALVSLSSCGSIRADDMVDDSGTNGDEIISGTETYIIFDNDTLDIYGLDAAGMIEFLAAIGEGHYIDIMEEPDGEVNLVLNEEQMAFWKEKMETELTEVADSFQDASPKYHCDFSEDYTSVNLYYDFWYLPSDENAFLKEVCVYDIIYQLLIGNYDYELEIEFNLYNVDTGKLIDRGEFFNEGIHYGDDEWRESYSLSRTEEETLLTEREQATAYHINSAFYDYDPLLVAYTLIEVNENTYSYLYFDEDGSLVLGLTEEERKDWVDACETFLVDISQDFASKGDGYHIEYEDNWTKINAYFDSSLSKQEQVDFVIYPEEVSMIMQTLNGEDFFVEMNIYNSETGEFVSSGDTIDGIEWNME